MLLPGSAPDCSSVPVLSLRLTLCYFYRPRSALVSFGTRVGRTGKFEQLGLFMGTRTACRQFWWPRSQASRTRCRHWTIRPIKNLLDKSGHYAAAIIWLHLVVRFPSRGNIFTLRRPPFHVPGFLSSASAAANAAVRGLDFPSDRAEVRPASRAFLRDKFLEGFFQPYFRW